MKKMNCSKCGKEFAMGCNGVWVEKNPVCDSCAGIERDKNGYIWFPDEKESTFEILETGKVFTISRKKAFEHSY